MIEAPFGPDTQFGRSPAGDAELDRPTHALSVRQRRLLRQVKKRTRYEALVEATGLVDELRARDLGRLMGLGLIVRVRASDAAKADEAAKGGDARKPDEAAKGGDAAKGSKAAQRNATPSAEAATPGDPRSREAAPTQAARAIGPMRGGLAATAHPAKPGTPAGSVMKSGTPLAGSASKSVNIAVPATTPGLRHSPRPRAPVLPRSVRIGVPLAAVAVALVGGWWMTFRTAVPPTGSLVPRAETRHPAADEALAAAGSVAKGGIKPASPKDRVPQRTRVAAL